MQSGATRWWQLHRWIRCTVETGIRLQRNFTVFCTNLPSIGNWISFDVATKDKIFGLQGNSISLCLTRIRHHSDGLCSAILSPFLMGSLLTILSPPFQTIPPSRDVNSTDHTNRTLVRLLWRSARPKKHGCHAIQRKRPQVTPDPWITVCRDEGTTHFGCKKFLQITGQKWEWKNAFQEDPFSDQMHPASFVMSITNHKHSTCCYYRYFSIPVDLTNAKTWWSLKQTA